MLDKQMLDWAPVKVFPVNVQSLGRYGPIIVQTSTFGSDARSSSWPDTTANELPLVPAKVEFDEEKYLAVPPAVKAWRLSHVDAKLRQEANISRFASCHGEMGALHAARLPSNAPCEDEWDARTAEGLVYAGIYDGHGDSSPEKIDNAVKMAFTKLDDAILNAGQAALLNASPCDAATMSALAPAVAGSCALLSIFDPESSILRVANVGDSRAVLGSHKGYLSEGKDSSINNSSYEAISLSKDQNAENQDEKSRIKAAHPGEKDDDLFQWGRFLGIMVTRAFGDHRWKWENDLVERVYLEFLGPQAKPGIRTPPYLTAEPVVTCTTVSARDFVILASDGFWDHVATEDAVRLIAEWLEKKKQLRQYAGHGNGAVKAPAPEKASAQLDLDFDEDGFAAWKAAPQHFVIEDMDNAAVHLLKNALRQQTKLAYGEHHDGTASFS